MNARRVIGTRAVGIVALAIVAAACGSSTTSLVTTPKPGQVPAPAPGSVVPFGAPPVEPPPALRDVASSYYAGAGPAPDQDDRFRPSCLLMLPTSIRAASVRPVPASRFNIFDEFEVTWSRPPGRGTGLVLFVYPPGDSSYREFFGSTAVVSTLPDGSELRTAPQRPNATLIHVPTQNCEYEMEAHGPGPTSALDTAVRSLRLIYDP